MELTQFDTMTETEIIADAERRGYTVYPAPAHYPTPGKRVGGSTVTTGADEWMNAANVRLYELQTGKKLWSVTKSLLSLTHWLTVAN